LPGGAKFCLECGKPLVEAAKPEPQPDPRSYTPKHLAEKILTSRSALEGERKQVTVLFADVKGSMDLAEQVDAEEWYEIMDRSVRHQAARFNPSPRIGFCPWQGSAFSEARLVAPHAPRQYERPWPNAASS
jgi:hypothetical protein